MKAFELIINNERYVVRCLPYIACSNARDKEISLKLKLNVEVFNRGKQVYPHKDSYVAEIITRYLVKIINEDEVEL